MEKLNCILCIDDDIATNVFNRIIIEQANCAEKCVTVNSGPEALEYLKTKESGQYPQPDLILLDINMPGMNGWEFLEEYKNLDEEQKGGIIIVMLTSSNNPDDKEKSITYDVVHDFKNKPLSHDLLEEIFQTHFRDSK